MRKSLFLIIIFLSIIFSSFTGRNNDVVNYYNIPDIIEFDAVDYRLAWSSHPSTAFYKQEYLPKKENAETFKNMVLIDFIITDLPVKTIVQAKVQEIVVRKQTDALANYDLVDNPETGEYIFDFLMSSSDAGRLVVTEWNQYRYKPYTDKAGHKGILLFGLSRRAYGDEIIPFMKALQTNRVNKLNLLADYKLPDIQVQ